MEEAAEVARKGLETAVALEELFVEVPLRELLREVYKNMGSKALTDAITENEYLLETASRKLTTLIRYTHINDRAFDYLRKYRVSDDAGVKRGMEELIDLPEMKDINRADSLPAQLKYYAIWNCYHSSRNEIDDALIVQEKELRLWESNPGRIKLYPHLYMDTLANMLGKLSMTGKLEESYLSEKTGTGRGEGQKIGDTQVLTG